MTGDQLLLAGRPGASDAAEDGGRPGVAAGVAARLLRAAGVEVVAGRDGGLVVGGEVECRLSWAGSLGLRLRSEADVQAACGVMHVHGRRYGAPRPLGVDFGSVAAGVLAAAGALAAVRAGRLGSGCRVVEVAVARAALFGLSQYLAAATAEERCAEPVGVGGPPFRSADGVWFEVESLDAEGWLRFWSRLGVARGTVGRSWLPFQSRYGTATCPLPAELFAAAGVSAYSELARLAEGCGVAVTAVAARPGSGGGEPWRLRAGATAGVDGASGERPPVGRPLGGVTVVEVARRVQGPMAGRVLALLGARVVRVEPVGGDPLRGVPPMAAVGGGAVSARFAALNRGKEVVEADLRSAEGRSLVRELVRGADVLLHSLAPAKVGALGLDAGSATALRPGLVHAQASGGGPGLATDYPVQARSGLAALLTSDGPPRPTLLTVCDVLGGLVCATGTVAALVARERTGRAQRVESSLLSAARLLCGAAGAGGGPGVEVCTDLAALAGDPRVAPAFEFEGDGGGCAFVRAPWEFRV